MKKQKFTIGAVLFWCVMAVSGAAWCGDNYNGTVTINGLVWLKDANCLGSMNWDSAVSRVKSLADGQCELTDKSKAGDWRLPTIDELKGIYSSKKQFYRVQSNYYWSSTIYPATRSVWFLSMYDGTVGVDGKAYNDYVLPVRSGQ